MNYKEKDYLKDLTEMDNLIEDIRDKAMDRTGIREEMRKLKRYSLQTYRHGYNVCRRVIMVGLSQEFVQERIIDMATAALLLDTGYQRIPLAYVEREGMLKNEEFEELKRHVLYSAERAEELGLSENIVEMVKNHHERNNGCGYLNKVPLSELPEDVQLVAACDCFEALKEKRPYRSRHSIRHAVELMKYQVDTDFDFKVVMDVTGTLIYE